MNKSRATKTDISKADFCLEINYVKDSPNPSRVFRSMSELIDTFQVLDTHLTKSIDVNIEPLLLLEDIETGSIKTWLATILKAIPDNAIANLNWKLIVGDYLVKAKYIFIDFLGEKTTISNIKELKPLEDKLYELAEKTQVRWLPAYTRIPPKELLDGMQRISESLSCLDKQDTVKYLTSGQEETKFNLSFHLAPESIEDLLAKEILSSENEMILKVKKPDYLGDSMWDMRHGDRIIQVRISDKNWLDKFQDRLVTVRPGDSIRAKVKISNLYGYDGELISTHYDTSNIIDVIPVSNPNQQSLWDEEGKDGAADKGQKS